MICIYCHSDLARVQSTVEHIIPSALGGRLTLPCVCKSCNDKLGSEVDCQLTDDYLIQVVRFGLRIPNGSGELISPLRHGETNGRPDATGTFLISNRNDLGRIQVDSKVHAIDLDKKTKTKKILGAPADVTDITRKIRERAVRRGGKVEEFDDGLETIKSPSLINRGGVSPESLVRPILKIAFELGVFWIGSGYAETPNGMALSKSVLSEDGNYGEREIDFLSPQSIFEDWEIPSYCHAGSIQVLDSQAWVSMRIFNIYEARVNLGVSRLEGNFCHWIVFDPIAGNVRAGVGDRPLEEIRDATGSSVNIEGVGENTFRIDTIFAGRLTHSIQAVIAF